MHPAAHAVDPLETDNGTSAEGQYGLSPVPDEQGAILSTVAHTLHYCGARAYGYRQETEPYAGRLC